MSKYDPKYYQANKAAHAARARKYRQRHPEKVRAIQRKSQHGVVPSRPEPEFCECCGRAAEETLCLDHDHRSGKFRGWLCRQCNAALGMLGDTLDGVAKALAYLGRAQ